MEAEDVAKQALEVAKKARRAEQETKRQDWG